MLEAAIGTGLNLHLYPPGVHPTGIEWSPQTPALARRRAEGLGRAGDLREGDAQALPFPDASFDTVVYTLSLWAIPDDRRAIAEMRDCGGVSTIARLPGESLPGRGPLPLDHHCRGSPDRRPRPRRR
ncbi:class I SAM-dependent methyltransferase [Streptomyces sp. ISL-43]|uniref:class I SAM-dependent methyltransferase n=1 Tax=Streptomyces sp. ISL-43 TaxID=2819183 RepID=UPI001BEA5CC2|nr:class I SAM-dependent methyltransferase [Streptomyces sp. ISL-43]